MLKKFAAFTSSAPFITFMAHSGWACIIVLLFTSVWTVAGLVALTAVKEFWFDLKYETGESYESGAVDFIGYLSGMALAIVLRVIFLH